MKNFIVISNNDFNDGYACVHMDGKGFNYINKECEFLLKEWVESADPFCNGMGVIGLDDGYYIINTSGEKLTKEPFDSISIRNGYKYIMVRKSELGYNFLDENLNLVSKRFFQNALQFCNGYAPVYINDGDEVGWNFIDEEGNLICKETFLNVDNFYGGVEDKYASVLVNGKGRTIINSKGERITDKFFDCVIVRDDGFVEVYNDDKGYNLIDKNGKLVSDENYDTISHFYDGYARVFKVGRGYNYMDKNGKLINKEWFDDASTSFKNGVTRVVIKNENYTLTSDGKLKKFESHIF